MGPSSADMMEGVEAANVEPETPLMTARETAALKLYDRLEELQLEIAFLSARGVILTQGKSSRKYHITCPDDR
jgi:hypothetical protein